MTHCSNRAPMLGANHGYKTGMSRPWKHDETRAAKINEGIDPAFFLAGAIAMVFAGFVLLLGVIVTQDQRTPYREAPMVEIGHVCEIEPSDTPEGFELIAYPDAITRHAIGFRVPCPVNGG